MSNCIWCIGRNFALHAKEMGNSPEKEPCVFIKAMASSVMTGSKVKLPLFSKEVHYETELALLFDSELNFSHITVALDLTARDLQTNAKKKGLPWSLSKSFIDSCPIGKWQKYNRDKTYSFSLHVNQTIRQKGVSEDMIFSIHDVREYLLKRFPVRPGDIVLMGTPENVSKVIPHDLAELFLDETLVGQWMFT